MSNKADSVPDLLFDVFGRRMQARRINGRWCLYLVGGEGKRRPVEELAVPREVTTPAELRQFLDDHFHEYATPRCNGVRIIDTA